MRRHSGFENSNWVVLEKVYDGICTVLDQVGQGRPGLGEAAVAVGVVRMHYAVGKQGCDQSQDKKATPNERFRNFVLREGSLRFKVPTACTESVCK